MTLSITIFYIITLSITVNKSVIVIRVDFT
jgi:hypothetical protein